MDMQRLFGASFLTDLKASATEGDDDPSEISFHQMVENLTQAFAVVAKSESMESALTRLNPVQISTIIAERCFRDLGLDKSSDVLSFEEFSQWFETPQALRDDDPPERRAPEPARRARRLTSGRERRDVGSSGSGEAERIVHGCALPPDFPRERLSELEARHFYPYDNPKPAKTQSSAPTPSTPSPSDPSSVSSPSTATSLFPPPPPPPSQSQSSSVALRSSDESSSSTQEAERMKGGAQPSRETGNAAGAGGGRPSQHPRVAEGSKDSGGGGREDGRGIRQHVRGHGRHGRHGPQGHGRAGEGEGGRPRSGSGPDTTRRREGSGYRALHPDVPMVLSEELLSRLGGEQAVIASLPFPYDQELEEHFQNSAYLRQLRERGEADPSVLEVLRQLGRERPEGRLYNTIIPVEGSGEGETEYLELTPDGRVYPVEGGLDSLPFVDEYCDEPNCRQCQRRKLLRERLRRAAAKSNSSGAASHHSQEERHPHAPASVEKRQLSEQDVEDLVAFIESGGSAGAVGGEKGKPHKLKTKTSTTRGESRGDEEAVGEGDQGVEVKPVVEKEEPKQSKTKSRPRRRRKKKRKDTDTSSEATGGLPEGQPSSPVADEEESEERSVLGGTSGSSASKGDGREGGGIPVASQEDQKGVIATPSTARQAGVEEEGEKVNSTVAAVAAAGGVKDIAEKLRSGELALDEVEALFDETNFEDPDEEMDEEVERFRLRLNAQ